MVDEKFYRGSMRGGLIHIKQLGFEPKTVIDVGAALGTFSLYEVFPDSRHILIEPIRENEPYLAKICKNFNNAEYIIAAATKELGLFTINVNPNLVHSSVSDLVSSSPKKLSSRTIEGITLDWLCKEKKLEPPYLIKVDVDGNEADVLAGAIQMLRETEYVIVEVTLFAQIYQVIECMKAQGFVVYDIVDLAWRPSDNALWQCDIAFVKESGQFRKNKAYIKKEQKEQVTTSLKNYRENLIAYIEDGYSEANVVSKEAITYYNEGKFKEAIATCKQAIELKPNLADAYLTMGNALQMLGNFDEAIASYSQALEIKPNLAAASANLGSVYLKQGKLDDAKSSSEEAIALEPELAIAYWNLGQVLNEENKLEEAVPYWQKALELKPDLVEPEFYRDLGNVLRERGKLDEAIDDGKLYPKLGDICLQRHQYEEAIFYHIKALQIQPDRRESYFSIGASLKQKGRLKDAEISFSLLLPLRILQEFGKLNRDLPVTSTSESRSIQKIKITFNYPQKTFLSAAKTIDEKVHHNLQAIEIDSPETSTVILPKGRAWGDFYTSAVFDADNRLLKDISTGNSELIASSNKLPPVSYLDGKVAFLSIRGVASYYHWMSDFIPRIELICLSGIELNSIDNFVVNGCNKQFEKETLEILGIPQNKIIESFKIPHLQAENLIVPSLPGNVGNTPKWVCDFLRKEFLKVAAIDSNLPERIYISRRKAAGRRIINEDEVLTFLERFGFEAIILESMPISQQVSFLAGAKVIIAPHGAGLTNLVFCYQETKVIEIFSPNYVNGCFWVIANKVGLDYYYLIGDIIENNLLPDSQGRHQYIHPAAEDILVNIDKLAATMQLAGIEGNSEEKSSFNNFNLRDVNLIIFPDWSQSEECLYKDFARVLKAIASHPEKGRMTLLIDTSNISEEDADLALSSMVMNLMMEEELDVEEGPNISLVGELSQIQWESLLSRVRGRIALECENGEAIARVKADSIEAIELDSLLVSFVLDFNR